MNRYRDNMKAIVTKFHGPTNHKGSRISATAEPKHRKAAAERQVSADELPSPSIGRRQRNGKFPLMSYRTRRRGLIKGPRRASLSD